MMTDHPEDRIPQLFHAALELDPGDRAAFLDDRCGDDSALRHEIDSLLRLHNNDTDFLERPLLARSAAIPAQLGPYRIIDVLGRGGMSVVYLAEQDHPRRAVALKVIRPEIATPSLLRRFEHEAQILAQLHHPGIAQVYDAATADTELGAQPYFAMEHVEGGSLIAFADNNDLSTHQRLALFCEVCHAVQHAHQKGVIHRDLKPSNILVDHAGRPKVLDFGIARVTDSDLQITTLQTDPGQLIGTLPYMSPEQVAGDTAALDTRSDIYALGVVCYELLSGRLPHELTHCSIPEAARVIRDDDPSRLGTVDRAYRGDIEAIVAKALEKDPRRRYPSAAEFAADVQRFLDDEPITAQPAGTIYQWRKFARRNRGLVAGTGSAVVLLVIGTIGTSWQAVRATGNERHAEERRQESEVVTEFVASMLSPVSPRDRGRNVTVREVLDRAALLIGTDLAHHPRIEARLHEVVGQAYLDLGSFIPARTHLELALELRRSLFGIDHPDSLRTRRRLALLEHELGHYPKVAELRTTLVETCQRVLGPRDPFTLACRAELVRALLDISQTADAAAVAEPGLDLARAALGEDDPVTIRFLEALGMVRAYQGNLAEAEVLFQSALDSKLDTIGERHPDTFKAWNNLAIAVSGQGDFDRAESIHRDLVDLKGEVLGPSHPGTLDSMYNLALLLKHRGRFAESEALYVDAINRARSSPLPSGHWRLGPLLSVYGAVLTEFKRYDEAERALEEAFNIMTNAMGPDDDETLQAAQWLVDLYELWDKPLKATTYRDLLSPDA